MGNYLRRLVCWKQDSVRNSVEEIPGSVCKDVVTTPNGNAESAVSCSDTQQLLPHSSGVTTPPVEQPVVCDYVELSYARPPLCASHCPEGIVLSTEEPLLSTSPICLLATPTDPPQPPPPTSYHTGRPPPAPTPLIQHDHLDKAISKEYSALLRRNQPVLVDTLNEHLEDFLDDLSKYGLLLKDVHQALKLHTTTSRDRTREFLKYLHRRTLREYLLFLRVLSTRHPDIYSRLVQDTDQDSWVNEVWPLGSVAVPSCVKQPDTLENYRRNQIKFHRRTLTRLPKEKPHRYNMDKYITLGMYEGKRHLQRTCGTSGMGEFSLLPKQGQLVPIQLENLFTGGIQEDEAEDPRTVVMLGVPGIGKTFTCYHLIKRFISQELFAGVFDLIYFLKFQEVNLLKEKLTFQDLLLTHFGPSVQSKEDLEMIWTHLEAHQERTLVVIDGYDEADGLGCNVSDEHRVCFAHTTKPNSAQVLLHNLIEGVLWERSRVLVMTRPHCFNLLEESCDRVVELGGLNKEGRKDMVNLEFEKLPVLRESFHKILELEANVDILWAIPSHFQAVLDHARSRGTDSLIQCVLPRTKASHMFILLVKLLKSCDRKLERKGRLGGLHTDDILKQRAATIQKLAKVASDGLLGDEGIVQLFSRASLADLTDDEIENGILSSYVTSMADMFGPETKPLFTFPHLTSQEHMCGLHLIQSPEDEIQWVVTDNDGSRDMILLLALGSVGDPMCASLLRHVYPHTTDNLSHKAQRILQAVGRSRRRYLQGGEIFFMSALHESTQTHMAGKLAEKLVNAFNALNLWHCNITEMDVHTASGFLGAVTRPVYDVAMWGDIQGEGLSRLVQSITEAGHEGLTLGCDNFSEADWKTLSNGVNDNNTLKRLRLSGYANMSTSHHCPLDIRENTKLQCFSLIGVIKGPCLSPLCSSLAHLQGLEALNLSFNDLSSADASTSNLTALQRLRQLRYVRMYKCQLSAVDMAVLTETALRNDMVWLDVSGNHIGDEGLENLSVLLAPPSHLLGLNLFNCDITPTGVKAMCSKLLHNKVLKVLDLSCNAISDGVEFVAELVQQNNCLEQLEVYMCELTAGDGCRIMRALQRNKSLHWLDVSCNKLNTEEFVQEMCRALEVNTHLEALCLCDCGMTDEALAAVTSSLALGNTSLKLLDISENDALSTTAVTSLINSSRLQVLGLCDLQMDDWGAVARALVRNDSIVTCLVGGEGQEDKLRWFLRQLSQNSSATAPLQHLLVRGDRSKLASNVCCLQQAVHGCNLTVSFVDNEYIMYALSGLWCTAIPYDISNWLYALYMNTV